MIIRTPIESERQWLEVLRPPNIGASEIAALLGEHDFKTAYGVIAQKLGWIPPDDETPAMRRGRKLEPIAIDEIREKFPAWRLERPNAYFHDPDLRVGSSPDLFATAELSRGVIQIKSVEPRRFAETWFNDAGELAPPNMVAIQAIVDAWLTDSAWAAACAIRVGYGIDVDVIPVPIHAGLIERIKHEAAAAWRLIDAGKLPDPDWNRDAAIVRQMLRQDDGSEVDLTADNELPEIVAERERAQAARSEADEAVKIADTRILHRIGKHQRARFAGGLITAKTIERKAYEVPASSYRQLRIKHEAGA